MQTKKPHSSIKTLQGLQNEKLIPETTPPDTLKALEHVANTFAISITPTMASLITEQAVQTNKAPPSLQNANANANANANNNNDTHENFLATHPIAQQFLPNIQELNTQAQELADPISDEKFSPIAGLIHRYPDRCLLKPVNVCPVYCRFCFRREQIGPNTKPMSKDDLQRAYHYIETHPEIWEVILTGGDPLILKPKALAEIIRSLNNIPHVEVIRIHTRIPVVDPDRISTSMINALKQKKAVFILLHANHASEFTPAAERACARLIDAGLPMLSQSVLLRGINDSVEALSHLMRTFVKHRIKPYYLHHGDLARGTSHFRTSIDTGQTLMKNLRGHYSGLCQPQYMLDIPGGYGKIPISPPYIKSNGKEYELTDYRGEIHCYCDTVEGSPPHP